MFLSLRFALVLVDMENSDAWKRLNVMATKWVKRVEGKGEMKLLGLDRDLGNEKEVNRETVLDGNQADLEIKGGENPGVEDMKERDVDSTVNQEENEDLPGFDQEQMNVLKALLHGVSREGGNPGVEEMKEGGVDSTESKEESEDLSGFDLEQMNILKALLHEVSRDSLVHVQGLSEPMGKRVSTQLGEKFTEVKDSVKVAKERGVGKGNISEGFPIPAGSYAVPGTYEVPDGEGGMRTVQFNTKGIPYEIDDPNLGYTSQEIQNPGKEGGPLLSNTSKGSKDTSSGRSWASVASASQRSDIKMRYFPSSHREVVLPPRENVDKWNACLVGYMFDRKLDFNFVKNRAFFLWKNKGLKEVTANEEGFFVFMFDSKFNAECVFEGGPYHLGGS